MIRNGEKTCPRCGKGPLKEWGELERDEKLLIEKLPAFYEMKASELHSLAFCIVCWHHEHQSRHSEA